MNTNRVDPSWFLACLLLTALAMFLPYHLPEIDGHPAGWYFLWDATPYPPYPSPFALRVMLPVGLFLCALLAWRTRHDGVRACALVPITFLSALQVLLISIQMSEWSPIPSTTMLVLDIGAQWALVLSMGIVAAMAFRLRRGLRAGRPYRWMTIASLVGIAAMAWTLRQTDLSALGFKSWCFVGGGGMYLLLAAATGIGQLGRGRRTLSFVSRLAIGSVIWVYALDRYLQYTKDLPSVVTGAREGAIVAIQYLAAAMLAVVCFDMRYGGALADETVFD